ncbi:NAC domain-containing protein 83-like [Typha latifolia]|uniref:NAC domain-containing protein 83-like n=1 Tax=Typha latifolia TaxID=4733 RepID=UPI003C2D20DF
MERPPVVMRHGVSRLPPGFRFCPTDEELVVEYLKRKVFSFPLPAAVIPEINLGKCDPWDLHGGYGEIYFFNLQEVKYSKSDRSIRATRSGYWKAVGKDKPIVASRSEKMVGTKKVFVFHEGKTSQSRRTEWVMHEFRLAASESRALSIPQRKNASHSCMVQTKDWVVCRIFKKNRQLKKFDKEMINQQCSSTQVLKIPDAKFINCVSHHQAGDRRPSSPSSSSSSSSCVTDLSDDDAGRENL